MANDRGVSMAEIVNVKCWHCGTTVNAPEDAVLVYCTDCETSGAADYDKADRGL